MLTDERSRRHRPGLALTLTTIFILVAIGGTLAGTGRGGGAIEEEEECESISGAESVWVEGSCATNEQKQQERTFVMVKPDGIQRGLLANVIGRFERKGYKLVGIKMMMASDLQLQKLYSHKSDKPFFASLLEYMTSGPVCAMVWEGFDVVQNGRKIVGDTDPAKALPGTIRGDYGIHIGRNICHASDSVESACEEIADWFRDEELVQWHQWSLDWVLE